MKFDKNSQNLKRISGICTEDHGQLRVGVSDNFGLPNSFDMNCDCLMTINLNHELNEECTLKNNYIFLYVHNENLFATPKKIF